MKFHEYLDYWQQPADDNITDIFLGNLELNSLAEELVEDISPLPPLADESCKLVVLPLKDYNRPLRHTI